MPEVAGGHQPMKRRGFIAAALALIPGVVLFRPKTDRGVCGVDHPVSIGDDGTCTVCGNSLYVNWDHPWNQDGFLANQPDPAVDAFVERYGRGPGFEALEDQHELERICMAGNSCGKTDLVRMEFERAITGGNEATSRDFDNMLERFRRKQGLS